MQIEKQSIWNKLKKIVKEIVFPKRFSLQERVILFKQLATLIFAGTPLSKALSGISRQHPNEHIKMLLEDIFVLLNKGDSLSEALSRHPEFFDAHSTALIAAGEVHGELGSTLKRLADSYEAKMELLHSIGNALFYPAFVLISSIAITVLLIYSALPSIEGVLYALNVPLPPLTSAALKLLGFFKSPFSIITTFAITTLVIILSKNYFKVSDNRKILEHLLYNIPFGKKLLCSINGIRFCQIFSDLHTNGLPLMACLYHTSLAMESLLAQDEIKKVMVRVTKGELLSEAVLKGTMFPKLIALMLSVGEQTGKLDLLLMKTHSYLTIDINYALEKFRQAIGPVLILILGVIITLFLLIFFLPIYSGMNAITL